MRARTLIAISASCLVVVAMTMGPRTSPAFAQAGSTGGGTTVPGGATPGPTPPRPGPTMPGPTAPGGPISPGPTMPGPTRPGGTTGIVPAPATPDSSGSTGTSSQPLTPGTSAPSGARIQQPSSGLAAPTSVPGVGTSGTAASQSTSSEVRRLQEQLRSQGHDPGAVNGVMGPQTQDALRAYQRSNGLAETGRLDTQTAEKLGLGTIRR